MEFDFEANGTITSLDGVPEQYRGLYVEGQTESGEKAYQLNESVAPLVSAYVGTNKSLQQARADKKAASDEAAQRRVTKKAVLDFVKGLGVEEVNEDEPLDTLNSYVANLTDQVKGGKELKINLDKIKQESEQRIAEAVAGEQEKTAKMQRSLERYLVGQAAASAIADAKGSRELLLPTVQQHVKVVQDGDDFVVRVVDEQGDFRSNGKGGWMGVPELIAEMKQDQRYARAFESEAPSGSGTRPGAPAARAPRQEESLTAAQKISRGLAAGQARSGRAA